MKTRSITVISLIFAGIILSAGAYTRVKLSLTDGWVKFWPVMSEVTGNGAVFTKRKSCFGICLGDLFSRSEKIPPKDQYIFINGDPDNMSMSYLNMVCINGYFQNLSDTHFSLTVKTGEINRQATFSMEVPALILMKRGFPLFYRVMESKFILDTGRFPNLESQGDAAKMLHSACQDEMKQIFAINHVVGEGYQDEIFTGSFDGEIYTVRWDVEAWRDEVERSYDKLLDRYHSRLIEYRKERGLNIDN